MVEITSATLADGREILYFDDQPHPDRVLADARDPHRRPRFRNAPGSPNGGLGGLCRPPHEPHLLATGQREPAGAHARRPAAHGDPQPQL